MWRAALDRSIGVSPTNSPSISADNNAQIFGSSTEVAKRTMAWLISNPSPTKQLCSRVFLRHRSLPPCVSEIDRRSREARRKMALDHVTIGRKRKFRQISSERKPCQFIDVIARLHQASAGLGKQRNYQRMDVRAQKVGCDAE
jgi:hypothetical protein